MYRQQWQADQQTQIIAKIAGKMRGKKNEGKIKINDRNHQISNVGRKQHLPVPPKRMIMMKRNLINMIS
jgi:hypothetical protein